MFEGKQRLAGAVAAVTAGLIYNKYLADKQPSDLTKLQATIAGGEIK